MRVITQRRLREFWQTYPDAKGELEKWHEIATAAHWKNPAEVKGAFGVRVDFVKVSSNETVSVFDIFNNKYRLIAAIHYNYPRVFVLRILTHKQYDTNKWKKEL